MPVIPDTVIGLLTNVVLISALLTFVKLKASGVKSALAVVIFQVVVYVPTDTGIFLV